MSSNTPVSPIGNNPMRLRMTVPMDWRRPETDQTYRIYWDDRGEYGMLYPRPKLDDVAAYYDVEDYYTHHREDLRRKNAVFHSFWGRVLGRLSWSRDRSVYINKSWLTQHLGTESKRVLDIGCGAGQLLAEIKGYGHEVVGVDPDAAALVVAQENGLEVYQGSAENLPIETLTRKFDAIFLVHVLEHCVDPVTALQNATALLAPGGIIIIETPNNEALSFEQAGTTWRWLDVPRHLNFFTKQSLEAICRKVKLEPAIVEYRGFARQFDEAWINDEQTIWDRYKARLNGNSHILPPRNTQWSAWKLFSQTLFAPDQRKYDSIRVIAVKK